MSGISPAPEAAESQEEGAPAGAPFSLGYGRAGGGV